MLNKNYEILCKLNLTQNNITVNDVIKAVSHQLKNVATKIIGETINDIQNAILDKFLGSRWTDESICKIIKLLEIKRHAKDNYDQYFKQNRRPIINLLQVSLCS